jgi:hypothetical protein
VERKIEKAAAYVHRHVISKNKKMMNNWVFWGIISLLDWSEENEEEIVETAIKELSTFTAWQIRRSEETLSYKLFLLDTLEHTKEFEYIVDVVTRHFQIKKIVHILFKK